VTHTITVGTTVTHPTAVEGYEVTRVSQNVVHVVPGKPDPDVTLRPASLRSGSITVAFEDEEDAWIAHQALSLGEVCTFETTTRLGLDMSFVTVDDIDISLDPTTSAAWHITFGFQEVDV